MFEWHGWAVIRGSAGAEDDADAGRVDAVRVAQVQALVASAAGVANEVVDLRNANGSVHLWMAGEHNHHSPDALACYELVAATAPGSYGVLYTHDDEDGTNAWTRWVMRRGTVRPETDDSLSPHVGLVEDPWPT